MNTQELPESQFRDRLVQEITQCVRGMIKNSKRRPGEKRLAHVVARRVCNWLLLSEIHQSLTTYDQVQASVRRHEFNRYLGYSVVVIWPDAIDYPHCRITVLVDIRNSVIDVSHSPPYD